MFDLLLEVIVQNDMNTVFSDSIAQTTDPNSVLITTASVGGLIVLLAALTTICTAIVVAKRCKRSKGKNK